MSTGPGESAAAGAGSDFLRDWQAVRGDASIQFAPLKEPTPTPPPKWLEALLAWIGEALAPVGRALGWLFEAVGLTGPIWPWVGGVVLLLLLGWLAWQWRPAKRTRPAPEADAEWTPQREAALILLEDADRLAGEGRYGEAAHLLLQRSVSDIAQMQPNLLRPSYTAREIASLPLLPDAARTAFGAIAERVERSLFALRVLDAADWQAAREAYARFALAPPVAAP